MATKKSKFPTAKKVPKGTKSYATARAEAKPPTVFGKTEEKVVVKADPPVATPTPSSTIDMGPSGAASVKELKLVKTDDAVIAKVTEKKALVNARRSFLGRTNKGDGGTVASDPEYQHLLDEWRKAAKGQQLPADLTPPVATSA